MEGSIVIDLANFGPVVAALLVVGGILKNAVPSFPNRLIPVVILVLGMLAYLALSAGWGDPGQWVAAFVAAAAAIGAHSGVKNSLEKS
jgi:hypothetical protein